MTIYRLITRGTIEEKIYQRQIFKVLLSNRILEDARQKVLFSKTQLQELFEFDDGSGSKDADAMMSAHMSSHQGGVAYDEHNKALPRNALLLPAAGQVDLLLQNNENTRGGRDSSTDGGMLRAGKQQTRAVLRTAENNEFFDIEDYNEEEQLQSLLGGTENNGESNRSDNLRDAFCPESATSLQISKSSGEAERDSRLLKALFDGDVISSIYNHNYLEGNSSSNSFRDSFQQAKVAKIVNESALRLNSSAPCFSAPAALNSAAASSVSYNSSSFISRGGQHDEDEEDDGRAQLLSVGRRSSDWSSSSAALIDSIRSQRAAAALASGGGSNQASLVERNGNQSLGGGQSSNRSSEVVSSSVLSSLNTMVAPNAIHQSILERLHQLFKSHGFMSTSFLLSKFKDLGDHYAPVFKKMLHSVAFKKDGNWYKKLQ